MSEMLRIRSRRTNLLTFDLPSGSLHLPGRGRASGDRCIATISADDLKGCASLQKALARRWVVVLKPKAEQPDLAKIVRPVATSASAVSAVEPNDGSDNE
jgi:hypothetical protein